MDQEAAFMGQDILIHAIVRKQKIGASHNLGEQPSCKGPDTTSFSCVEATGQEECDHAARRQVELYGQAEA